MISIRRIGILTGATCLLLVALVAVFRWLKTGSRMSPSPRTALSTGGRLSIVRHPPREDFSYRKSLDRLPVYDAESRKQWQVDLRSRDVSELEMANRLVDLRHADFDSRTRWPAHLPAGYDPAQVLALNKNPGLGVRALHARGVTGAGVGLAIIDQALLVQHVEYRDRLRSYEEIHLYGERAQMHGPAVASIAVGQSVGVAPGADLYYIAETHGTYENRKFEWDFKWLADSMARMLEINATLPANRKIRVISVSVGWTPERKGFAETMAAVARATEAGVFVISTAMQQTHGFALGGLGRDLLSDPDCWDSYRPGQFWAKQFWAGRRAPAGRQLLVPMDSRATASPTGAEDYVFYSDGGLSWAVPWLAGLYALACQVRPEITPEIFWQEALKTGRSITIEKGAEQVALGMIADPAALIDRLQARTGDAGLVGRQRKPGAE